MGGIGSGRKCPAPKPLNRQDLRNIRRWNRDAAEQFKLSQLAMVQRLAALGYSGREIGELLGYGQSWASLRMFRV